MRESKAHWQTSRRIEKRIIVRGKLELLTPTQIGSGDQVGPSDMTLLRDPLTSTKPLLPGPSIAGALRNYLREYEHGYRRPVPEADAQNSPVVQLFGGRKGYDEGGQSLLVVDDAIGEEAEVEIRDGVRIDSETGTAADRAKFDMELLEAGTTFDLRFELLVPQGRSSVLKSALATALRGFERGEIALGARKRRGFGRCRVTSWEVAEYDLTDPRGLGAWLERDQTVARHGTQIEDLLETNVDANDARDLFVMDLTCWLDGSLIVRAASQAGTDAGHLHTKNVDDELVPVLPGTSLAGVLRHRALRIANTLAASGDGSSLVDGMFGKAPKGGKKADGKASRVWVRETVIEGACPLVQSRVKIDRFTGGAYPTALFSEEPLFGGPDSRVRIHVSLRNPREHEVGLLMLLLKDLWTADLPVGGEISVGRGRMRGIQAELRWKDASQGRDATWTLLETSEGLQVPTDAQSSLEGAVKALRTFLKEEDHEAA